MWSAAGQPGALGRHGLRVSRAVHLVEVRDQLVQVVPLDLPLGRLLQIRRDAPLADPLTDRLQSSGGQRDGDTTGGAVAGQEVHVLISHASSMPLKMA